MKTRTPRRRNPALLAAMAKQGFNNRPLSAKSGLTTATISRALNRRVDSTPNTQARIARVLGHPAAELFPPEVAP